MLKANYDFVQYASLEQQIELDKANYYKALMLGQRYRDTEEEVIGSWLNYFLKAIKRSTKKLDGPGRNPDTMVMDTGIYLNQRQNSVMNYFERKDVLSVGDIDRLLPEVSRNTLK